MIGVGAAILAFRGNNIKRIITLYYCSLVFTYLSITFFTPGAEKISQNAAIEFIKGKAGKDAYLHSFYKSYAVLFYGKQGIPSNPNARSTKWLTSKNADKDVYFIMRIDKKPAIMKRYPNLEILYEKNGYVFAMNRISNTKNP